MISESMSKENDDDVVAKQSQQLLQKTSIDVSYPIYQRITNYLSRKYPNSELSPVDKLNEANHIFVLGIEKAEKELECKILFEENKPRKDVLTNLGKIANEFLKSPTYPEIRAVTLRPTINKVLGLRDNRTIEKYERCIHQYIGRPGELGLTDVSSFVERIPKQFMDTTSSTSSFGDKN